MGLVERNDRSAAQAPHADEVAPYARMALDAVRREYPYHLQLLMRSEADAGTPRRLTPIFWGAFDWHSAVHGHWTLARFARLFPDHPDAAAARDHLGAAFTAEAVAGEAAFLETPGREGFERPYGLAWLLQLCAELREWDDRGAMAWCEALEPLERLAARRFAEWLPKLPSPVRSGEHSQTAFALGLVWDWTGVANEASLREAIATRAQSFYGRDRDAPLAWEPSGHDFLSPVLGEADLMRRTLAPDAYAKWFGRLVPDLRSVAANAWLTPVTSPDPADGKLSHLDGLNLSRAWMLEGVASALPEGDPHLPVLASASARHRARGLAAVNDAHYAGGHWLGSFATYLVTQRGLG